MGEVFQQTVEYIDPKEAGLELWSVTVENGLTPKSERYNREFLVKKNDKFKAIHPDEIVYNPMNMTLGSIGFNNSGKDVAVSGYYVTMKLNEGFDTKYFATWLPSPNAINLYKLYATGSLIERQRVQFPTLSGIKTLMPSLNEQKQIGLFFKQLDTTTALHQQKLDQLKRLKQGFLQILFGNKEQAPKVRFAGFDEEWEQRKLGEVVQITMGQSPNSEYYTENPLDHILVQGNADMKNNRVVPRVWTTQVTKQAEKGDLILSVRAPVGDIGITDYDVVLGRGVAAIKGNDFIFQQLVKMKKEGFWNRFSTGSTFESINSNDIKEALITIPNGDEQKSIGSFFANLDTTIALHQTKLEKLKQLKQAFLQSMFI